MENKSHALAAGLFVLAVTALLLAMTLWLMRDTSDRIPVQMRSTEAVSGLQPQAVVRFRGVDVGVVTGIRLDAERPGHVLIDTMIDRSAPIATNSVGTLSYQGVTGLAFIQLDLPPSGATAPLIKDAPEKSFTIALTGSFMSRLTDQGGDMMKGLQQSIERFNQLMGSENQESFRQALIQANESLKKVSESANAISQLANSTDALLKQQLDPARASLPKLIETTQVALTDMRQAANQVGTAATSFNNALGRFDAQGGPLDQVGASAQSFASNTLPRLNSTLENAERTLRQLSLTAQGLSENPQSVLYGSGSIPPGPGEPGFVAPAATHP